MKTQRPAPTLKQSVAIGFHAFSILIVMAAPVLVFRELLLIAQYGSFLGYEYNLTVLGLEMVMAVYSIVYLCYLFLDTLRNKFKMVAHK
jgi:hypothetical protein